jgi:hypothetical protein
MMVSSNNLMIAWLKSAPDTRNRLNGLNGSNMSFSSKDSIMALITFRPSASNGLNGLNMSNNNIQFKLFNHFIDLLIESA